MNKKPLAIKVTVLLLCLYGVINLVSNYVYAFYVSYNMGFFSDIFSSQAFNGIGFIISSILVIPIFIAAILIWRGRRLGYWVSIILLALSFLGAIGGIFYLETNLPKLFTQDLLYLTKNPSPGMSWILDNSVGNFAYMDNLIAFRILIIKSLLKAVIEIITFGFLIVIVLDSNAYFKAK